MKIIDENNLMPDHDVLRKVICKHPFDRSLSEKINEISIQLRETHGIPREGIEFDYTFTSIELGIGEWTHEKKDYESILYHEFGHAADRLNPAFKYSDEKKAKLTENERFALMELWNLYIDARLNKFKLFVLPFPRFTSVTINGKQSIITPKKIDDELLCRRSSLECFGFPHSDCEKIVYQIWNKPEVKWSYDDLIEIVKKNIR